MMPRLLTALITACLLVLTVDTERVPGHSVEVVWIAAYVLIVVSFLWWVVTAQHVALNVFYGSLTVTSGVRAVMLAVVDHRFAGAALNVLLIVFLRDWVRVRRIGVLR